jgi:hypothetical protein
MDLNNGAGANGKRLDSMFRLAKGVEVTDGEASQLSPSQLAVCRSYAEKRFDENIGETVESGPAILQHMEGFVRAESALSLYRSGKMPSADFTKFVSSHNVPSYLHEYYLGIDHYRNGRIEQAYQMFDRTRVSCGTMVLKYMRYFEGSIRGAMSARPLAFLQEALDGSRGPRINAVFPFELLFEVPIDKPIHVVGCDFVYWERYASLFKAWASELQKVAYVCVVAVNFSDEQINAIRSSDPRILIARCKATFTNLRPFYTMARFLVADRLMRAGCDAVTCSDIDAFVEAGRYSEFVIRRPEGASTTFSRGWYPWRSVGAEFTLWKGRPGRAMLACMAGYFVEVFGPNIPAGNRQWWIDQFPIAMFADATELGLQSIDLNLRQFHPTARGDLPIKGPGDFKISKEEFAQRFGAGSVSK